MRVRGRLRAGVQQQQRGGARAGAVQQIQGHQRAGACGPGGLRGPRVQAQGLHVRQGTRQCGTRAQRTRQRGVHTRPHRLLQAAPPARVPRLRVRAMHAQAATRVRDAPCSRPRTPPARPAQTLPPAPVGVPLLGMWLLWHLIRCCCCCFPSSRSKQKGPGGWWGRQHRRQCSTQRRGRAHRSGAHTPWRAARRGPPRGSARGQRATCPTTVS